MSKEFTLEEWLLRLNSAVNAGLLQSEPKALTVSEAESDILRFLADQPEQRTTEADLISNKLLQPQRSRSETLTDRLGSLYLANIVQCSNGNITLQPFTNERLQGAIIYFRGRHARS